MARKKARTGTVPKKQPRTDARVKQAARTHPARPTRVRGIPPMRKKNANRIGISNLPPGLRITIYEYALTPDSGLRAIRLNAGPPPALEVAFGLLATSKAVRDEALGVFLRRLRTDSIEYSSIRDAWVALDSRNNWWDADPNQEWTQPWVRKSIKALGPKLLSAARVFTLALHIGIPHTDRGWIDCPEVADVVLKLKLLRKKPHYKLELVSDLSKADEKYRNDVVEDMSAVCENIFQMRGVRGLALNDFLEIVQRLAYR